MQVAVSTEGAVTIVKPMGPIITGEMEELDHELAQISRNWTKRLVIDMSEVTYVDSAGLEMLCYYRRELAEKGLKLKLSNFTDMTQEIFDLTRLTKRYEIFADKTAAVRSFL